MEKDDVKRAYETLLTSIELNGQVRKYSSVNHSSKLFLNQTKGSDLLVKEKGSPFELTDFINGEHTSGFT